LSSDAKRFLESLNKFKGDGASIATAIWESQGRVDNGQDLRDKLYGAAVKIKPDIFPDRPYPSSTQRVEIVWIVRCGWHPLEFVSIIVRAFDGQIPVLDYEWRGHVDSQNPWFNWCAQFETQCGLE
jgi:hypothetical protein